MEPGRATVRQIQENLSSPRPVGYPTVLKLLQIMTAKGLVWRNEKPRAHIYEAHQPAEDTKQRLAGDVLERVFEGSVSQMVLHLLAKRQVTGEDLDEMRRLIDQYEDELS